MTPAQQLLQDNPQLLDEIIADHLLKKRQQESQNFKEPVDANVVANPNLGKNLQYPRLVYHHGRKATKLVNSKVEHDEALAAGHKNEPWVEKPVEEQPKQEGFSADSEERFESLENRLLSLEQGLGEIQELLKQLKKK